MAGHLVLYRSKVSLEQTFELVCRLVEPGKYWLHTLT